METMKRPVFSKSWKACTGVGVGHGERDRARGFGGCENILYGVIMMGLCNLALI